MLFPNRTTILNAAIVLFVALGITSEALATVAPCPTCGNGLVEVTVGGNACLYGQYTITVSTPQTAVLGPMSGGPSGCGSYSESKNMKVRVVPERSYQMTLKGTGLVNTIHAWVSCPPCYRIYIDGVETNRVDMTGLGCDGPYEKTVKLVIKGGGSPAGGAGSGAISFASHTGGLAGGVSLGSLSNGSSAGTVGLLAAEISPTIFTTAALSFVNNVTISETYDAAGNEVTPAYVTQIHPEIDEIRDSGTNALRQIKVPDGLADICTLTPTSCQICFYPPAQVTAKNSTSGLYGFTGIAARIWKVSSPDNSSSLPEVKITETTGTVTENTTISYDSGTTSWTQTSPGMDTENLLQSILPNGDLQVESMVSPPNAGVISTVRNVNHAFPWGSENILSIVDPGGANLTTTRAFYEDAAENWSYGKLKWEIQPDGTFQRYEYYKNHTGTPNPSVGEDSPSFGNVFRIFRIWKDGTDFAGGGHPSSATLANSHVTTFTYTTNGAAGAYFKSEVQTSTVSILNQIVTTSQTAAYSKADLMISGSSRPVRISREGNFPTTYREAATIEPTLSVPTYLHGKLAYTRDEDGRRRDYSYETGTYANGVFASSASGIFIRAYETEAKTTAQNAIEAVPGKHLRTVTITDPCGKTVSTESQIKNTNGYASLSLTRNTYDTIGQLTQTTMDGRVTYDAVWANGRLSTETDETGITTIYNTYDAEGRVTHETCSGVLTTRVYDAAGRITSNSRSANGLTLTTSTTFDDAGRVETETAEDGLVTTTTYPSARITTRINPDTSTETTETYLDGQTKSVIGTAIVPSYSDYGVDANGLWSKQSIISPTSPRFTQSWTNSDGSVWRTASGGPAGPINSITTFDPVMKSRPLSRAVPGEATILYAYDPDTRTLTTQARDLNGNGIIDYAGTDAIETTETLHVLPGNWYRQTVSSRHETDGQATATALSTTREQLSGLGAGGLSAASQNIDAQGNVTSQTTTINCATRTVTSTTDVPDSNLNAVNITIDGKPYSTTTPTVSTPTVYNAYDALGRSTTVTSPRGVVTTTAYDPATGRVTSVTQAGQPTSYTYYPAGTPGAGRVATEIQPDTKVIRTAYTLRGEVFHIWGGATNPLERTYDGYGQPQFLKTYRAGSGWTDATWPAAPGTPDTTEWKYFDATGLLYQKIDAAGKATTYAYYPDGKMQTRQRARGPVTTYTWNSRGLPESTTHSDGTPSVTVQYDRASRPKTLVDAAGTHTYDYSVPLKTTEIIVGGILGGVSRSATRDTYERPSAISVTSGGVTHATGYQYTAASRLDIVTNVTESATYAYLANSDAIQTLTFKSGSTTRLTTTRSYDASDRLDGVTNAYGSSQLQTFGVSEFDAMNRRKKITREDATRWNYGYNDKGEVTSGIREKTAAPSTAVPGWNHGYSFDEIGNRLGTITNGRASTYTPNNLNQIESKTIPRSFDVIGKAAATATVTLNTLATTRLDEYFYKELPAGSGAVHVPYSVAATDGTGTTTRSAGKFLPASPESSTYDFDGNLEADGRFTYTWDAENRLIAMESLATVPVIARRKLTFAYDAMGRRIRKTTSNGTSAGTWQPNLDLRFLHEPGGRNIQAEITADSKFLRTYTWGTDLSGSLSGAGGVGGLLFTKIHPDNSLHANGMDLNGNVTLLVSTTTGQATATYDYGPFGEPLRESGEYAKLNPYRFSTKYADDETGLMDYGRRYYGSSDGRWKSRDPIEEEGGLNLYGFVGNDGINHLDSLGEKIVNPIEYTIKTDGYLVWRAFKVTAPHWRDVMDDWFYERPPGSRTYLGIGDRRNRDIASNIGFKKLLRCWIAQRRGAAVPPGRWDVNPAGIKWQYALTKADAAGGAAAYTSATEFLGTYDAGIVDKGPSPADPTKNIYSISVSNLSGWESATRIPTRFRFRGRPSIFPNHFRRNGRYWPFKSIGGNMPNNYQFEVQENSCSTCVLP